MSAALRSSALYESALRSLEARPRVGPPWLSERRAVAAATLRTEGFPHNRQEAWRFSTLRPLLQLAFAPEGEHRPLSASLLDRVVPEGAHRVICVNGRALEPVATTLGGARVMTLGQALTDGARWVEEHLARLSAGTGGFAAQNDALFEDAVVIGAERTVRVPDPIYVVHAAVSAPAPTVSYPRLLVVAEPGSHLSVVEVFASEAEGPHLQSALTEIVLEEGASVSHTRVQLGYAGGFTIAGVEVDQRASSRFSSSMFTFGGTLSRVDLRIRLAGDGAVCNMDGLYAASAGEQVEHHTRVDHQGAGATSDQLYKGVVDDGGQAVFDGTVIVDRGASGTVAHQRNRNLLLSDGARVHAKPHLEIDTDDVTCSHGATVGQLDENQIFYLRSRGMDGEMARAVLVGAFAKEMVERVTDRTLRDHIAGLVRSTDPLAHSGGEELA